MKLKNAWVLSLAFLIALQPSANATVDASTDLRASAAYATVSEVRNREYADYEQLTIDDLISYGVVTREALDQLYDIQPPTQAAPRYNEVYREALRKLFIAVHIARTGFNFAAEEAMQAYVDSITEVLIELNKTKMKKRAKIQFLRSLFGKIDVTTSTQIKRFTPNEKQLINALFANVDGLFSTQNFKPGLSRSSLSEVRYLNSPGGITALFIHGTFVVVSGVTLLAIPFSIDTYAAQEQAAIIGIYTLPLQLLTLPIHGYFIRILNKKRKVYSLYKQVRNSCSSLLYGGSWRDE